MSKMGQEYLSQWIHQRGANPGPLFFTKHLHRVDSSFVRKKLREVGKMLGLDGKTHPHAFRHTFARELHDEEISVRIIQKALGHKNLNTTQVYLQGLGDPEVIAVTGGRE